MSQIRRGPKHPLEGSAQYLTGVGPTYHKILQRVGIHTLLDVLRYYPVRWVDRRTLVPLRNLTPADADRKELGEDGRYRKAVFTVLGRISKVPNEDASDKRSARKGWRGKVRPLEASIEDDTGSVQLAFFGLQKIPWQLGSSVLVSGTLTNYHGIQFQNPEVEPLDRGEEAALHSGSLFPVYALTKGLSQKKLRSLVRQVLDEYENDIEDWIPEPIRARHGLTTALSALWAIHFPKSYEDREHARLRLAFEELFLDQIFVGAVRRRRERGKRALPIPEGGARFRRILASLPFRLTRDQERVLREILADLAGTRPMNRLLQGDVGSGKTVVALLAVAAAADAGIQTAFMAPTEILVEQHLRTLRGFAGGFDLEPRLLTGSTSAPARREILRDVGQGTALLVVGTHALFQESVAFHRLGLVVVDEQHRFGVMQRVALLEKGEAPHVLVMSATPIPRSLALVRFADLDLSTLREKPAGRGPVLTRITTEDKREAVYGFIADRLAEGRQAYVIYPLVEESEKIDLRAATTMALHLTDRFPGHQVALLHGQMPSDEKDDVMTRFVSGEIGVLVATTVVEVGIDVPNASVLVIEHPERYGLSQLHQLRGRIGRGPHRSVCVLVRSGPLDAEAFERLQVFAKTDDGFELARHDLRLRGQGDLVGTRQSGRPVYKLADPIRDEALIEAARKEAEVALEKNLLESGDPQWEPLRRRVNEWLRAEGVLVEAG